MDGYAAFVKALGKWVRGMRKEAGMSQRTLAESVGMTQNAILNYEHAWTCMSAWTLLEICKVLGVSADEMLGLEKEKD